MKLRLLLMSLPILSSLAACTVVEDARITESTKEICDHYSIPYVHLSGIDTQEGHPTVAGMDAIARQVLELITH